MDKSATLLTEKNITLRVTAETTLLLPNHSIDE